VAPFPSTAALVADIATPKGLEAIRLVRAVNYDPSLRRALRMEPRSPGSYALAGYARELGLSPKAQRYAEYRVTHPEDTKGAAALAAGNKRAERYEKDGAVRKYMAALAHVAAGRSLASWDEPSRIQETIGDAAELMAILWRRARFKLGDYTLPDGSPDWPKINAAPPGTFAGWDRAGRPIPTDPGDAQALLAKVLNLGHVNDPTTAVQVNLVQTVQALGRLSDGALRELQDALSRLPGAPPAPALPAPHAAQAPAAAVQPEPPEPRAALEPAAVQGPPQEAQPSA
jgi:hypothetical protein